MGKKSMSKDRGYITATEWKTEGGGYKDKMQVRVYERIRWPSRSCSERFYLTAGRTLRPW